MTRDEVVAVALVLSFAALVTAHFAIVVGLAARKPRWRAPAALVVVPLAPWWAHQARMHVRFVAWIVAAVAYAVLRAIAWH